MKRIISFVLVVVVIFSLVSVSFADSTSYSLTNKYVHGSDGQPVKEDQTRNEPNTLDFKATNIVWRTGMSDADKMPRFSGHYAGTSTKCTYVKDIVLNRYKKATYTGGSIGTQVDVFMSIASSSLSDYMYISGYGLI